MPPQFPLSDWPRRTRDGLRVFVHLALLWPAVFWLAWTALIQVNFLYPLDYRLLDIPATIAKYAPQNRHGKQNFIKTNEAERERLFAAITQDIQQGGHGLAKLHYHDPQGRDLGVFLTPAEVTHLTDVSGVVVAGDRIGFLALLGWLLVVAISLWRKIELPGFRAFSAGTGLSIAAAGLIVTLIGPMQVFNAFHRSVFPPNHTWFFYYQDSLMTTFMQAPTLFGLIVLWWLALALVFLLMLWVLARSLDRVIRHPHAFTLTGIDTKPS